MEDLIKQFPSLALTTYLDTPANGIIPHAVIKWRRQHDQFLLEDPAGFRKNHAAHLERVRMKIGQHFNAGDDQVALIPNFSLGMNILLESLPKDSNILLLKNDYPSILWPSERRDFKVEYAKIDENLEKNIAEAVNKYKPSVFIFSVVQWLNGIKIDLEFLKLLKLNNPDLLLVADGTQYLGTEKFNFSESGIDVLISSCYKWLLGGFGSGFILLKKEVRTKINLRTIGFNSAATFASKMEDTSFMKHFEPGHLDTLNFGSLEKSLELVEILGREDVYSRISKLANLAKIRFAECGLLQQSVVMRNSHSSIFNLNGDMTLFKKLRAENICCSPRGDGIRVGFHFYNTEEDLNRLLELVKQ